MEKNNILGDIKMKRSQLRKLILEEMKILEGFTSTGPNRDDMLSSEEVMKLVAAGIDVRDVDKSNLSPEASSVLGLDSVSPEKSGPLTTADLIALMSADKDPDSDYKLSLERLGSLDGSNLSDEEKAIVS